MVVGGRPRGDLQRNEYHDGSEKIEQSSVVAAVSLRRASSQGDGETVGEGSFVQGYDRGVHRPGFVVHVRL